MTQTSRYALPLLQSGQAQKEITHNGAIAAIDALLHLVVDSRTLSLPPAAGDPGAWIVAAGASGVWAGRDGQVAVLDEAGYSFITPRDGCVAFVRSEQVFIYWVAGAWHDSWPVRSLLIAGRPTLNGAIATILRPVGGTIVDTEGRAVLTQILTALQALGLITSS